MCKIFVKRKLPTQTTQSLLILLFLKLYQCNRFSVLSPQMLVLTTLELLFLFLFLALTGCQHEVLKSVGKVYRK